MKCTVSVCVVSPLSYLYVLRDSSCANSHRLTVVLYYQLFPHINADPTGRR